MEYIRDWMPKKYENKLEMKEIWKQVKAHASVAEEWK